MSKYTPWFQAKRQNPLKVGVYQVRFGHCLVAYKHWDGRYWGWFGRTPAMTEWEQVNNRLPYQTGFQWRGLAKKPKQQEV